MAVDCAPSGSGSACALACPAGLTPSPVGAAYVCTTGKWDSPPHVCAPDPCTALPQTPPNSDTGTMSAGCLPTASGSTCPLACATGYVPEPAGAVYTCTVGTWNDMGNSCEPAPCNTSPPAPANADIAALSQACVPRASGDTCNVDLPWSPGFSPSKASGFVESPPGAVYTCTDGSWNAPDHSCEPQPCDGLPTLPAN
eukprot:gene9123-8224_t